MSPQELLQAGRLADAIDACIGEVKAHPTDSERRYLLFLLLVFAGDLERAERQLDAYALGDAKREASARVSHMLLASEGARRAVHTEGVSPLLPDDAPDYVNGRLEALERLRAGAPAEAAALIEASADAIPPLSGTLDGKPFEDLRDDDDLLAPVLEVYARGQCLWLPFERLRRLEIAEPVGLVDLIWARARLEDSTGTVADVHVPVLYAGSGSHADEAVKLGRQTDWVEEAGLARGAGQKMLLTAQDDALDAVPLLGVRVLEIAPPAGGEGSDGEG